MKFISLMQNDMPITVMWSKPEEDFEYGERLFFRTGSSYNYVSRGLSYRDEVWKMTVVE